MTLRMTLDAHSPLEIRVGLPDDGIDASVHLELELHESDFVGRIPELEEPDDGGILVELDDGPGAEEHRQRMRADRLEAELRRMTEHADALRSRLESVKAERALWRELLPEEARALASMLWHYADRADAPR